MAVKVDLKFPPVVATEIPKFVDANKNLLQNQNLSNAEKLLAFAKTSNPQIQEQALNYLLSAVSDATNHDVIVQQDLVTQFLRLLQSNQEQLVVATANAYATLAGNQRVRDALRNPKVLCEFVAVLKGNNDAAKSQIARTFALLAQQNEQNQNAIREAKAIPALLHQIKTKYLDQTQLSLSLFTNATLALAQLSPNVANATEILEGEGATILVQALQHSANTAAGEYILSTFICCTATEKCRIQITEARGPEVLLPLLQNPKASVLKRALQILSNLCVDPSNRTRIVNIENAIEALVNFLPRADAKPLPELPLMLQLFKLLHNLVVDDQISLKFADADGIPKLISWAKNGADAQLQQLSIQIIANILNNDETHLKFTLNGGVPLLISLLESPNVQLRSQVASCITCLSQFHDDVREEIGSSGGISAIVSLLSVEDSKIKSHALRALTNLALSYENTDLIMSAGVMKYINPLLQQNRVELLLDLTKLLVNLCANDRAIGEVLKSLGGLDQTFALLNSTDAAIQLRGLKIIGNMSRKGRVRKMIHERGLKNKLNTFTKTSEKELQDQMTIVLGNLSFPFDDTYFDEDESRLPPTSGIDLTKKSKEEKERKAKQKAALEQERKRQMELEEEERKMNAAVEEEERKKALEEERKRKLIEEEQKRKAKVASEQEQWRKTVVEEEERRKKHEQEHRRRLVEEEERRQAEARAEERRQKLLRDAKELKLKKRMDMEKTKKPQPQAQTKIVSPPSKPHTALDPTNQKMQSSRTSIVKEILSTEKSYVKSLSTIIWKFMKPLESVTTTKKPFITTLQIKTIFSNIEIIYNFNSILLEGLENRLKTWSETTRIGDIFLKMTDFLRCYVEYVNNYNNAVEALHKLKKEKKEFEKFLGKQERNPICQQQPLESFLIMPVQRVPRYEMLLKELVKHTWQEHVDYNDLNAAYSKMRDTGQYINEKKREAENIEKLFLIEHSVAGGCPPLLEPSRRFLSESSAGLVKKSGTSPVPAFLHLFNDSIMVSEPGRFIHKYRFLLMFLLKDLSSIEKLTNERKAPNAIKFVVRNQNDLIINLASPGEREDWIKKIMELRDHDVERRKSFLKK